MKKCIIPGSYDPVTRGHIELFKEAAEIFDVVYPVILCNSEKKSGLFSAEERLTIMNSAISKVGTDKIIPQIFSGLTTDSARSLGADFIVKGVRNANDFTYEYELAEISRRFDSTLQTVFIPAKSENAYVSSTYIRELIKYGKFNSADFAEGTAEIIANILNNR